MDDKVRNEIRDYIETYSYDEIVHNYITMIKETDIPKLARYSSMDVFQDCDSCIIVKNNKVYLVKNRFGGLDGELDLYSFIDFVFEFLYRNLITKIDIFDIAIREDIKNCVRDLIKRHEPNLPSYRGI